MRPSAKTFFITALLSFWCFLSGCSPDLDEINNLAIVSVIGLDMNDEGKYIGYYQVVNPAGVVSQKGGGGTIAPVYTYRFEAELAGDFLTLATRTIPRKVFTSHFQAYIISEKVAKKGLREFLNFMENDTSRRSTVDVFITKESVWDLMNNYVPIEKMPGRYLRSVLKLRESEAGLSDGHSHIKDLIKNYNSMLLTVIPNVRLYNSKPITKTERFDNINATESSFYMDGSSLIKQGRLVGNLRENELGVYFLLSGDSKANSEDIVWSKDSKTILQLAAPIKVKRKLSFQNNRPTLSLQLKAKLMLTDNNLNKQLSLKVLDELTSKYDSQIEHKGNQLVKRCLQEDLDILGIQEAIRGKSGSQWRQMKQNEQAWKEVDVHISVKSTIDRVGASLSSFNEKAEEK